jgi:hypothetical protein
VAALDAAAHYFTGQPSFYAVGAAPPRPEGSSEEADALPSAPCR